MAHPDSSHSAQHADVDVELPCIDGLLAGTLALMTGYAEHQCEQGKADSRHLMAKKVVSNLFFLTTHPQIPTAFAAVLRNLQSHWHTLSALGGLEAQQAQRQIAPGASASPAPLWLPEHASVQ